MKAQLRLGWLGTLALGCLVAGNATSDVWVWDFPIDESQVKNGPEPDGSTNSPGKGYGHIEYDSESREFTIRIRFEGLVGDLSKLHVHGPSKPSRSTPRHVIEFLGPPEIPETLATTEGVYETRIPLAATVQEGFITLPAERILALLIDGHTYLNVHTTVFGMGEIRGNLGKPAPREQAPRPRIPEIPRRMR
ncbi:MAG: CHRD domain-containing protein [Myxococcota bacterium]